MLRLHWGAPKHPTEIRAWTGALGFKDQPWTHCYTSHGIGRWYGVSFRRSWFFGFERIARSASYRTIDPPRVGLDDDVLAAYLKESAS